MEYVYILACQRGQGGTEIHSMWSSYEGAILAYHDYVGKEKFNVTFMFLYKMPLDVNFQVLGRDWSDVKIQKSSKYRVKLTYEELQKEYQMVSRSVKINTITN